MRDENTRSEPTRLGHHYGIVCEAIAHLLWLDDVQRALVTENVAHAVWYAEQDEQRTNELLAACKALLDAPHQDHFASRLNDEEMAALNSIRVAVAKAERGSRS